MKQIIFASFLIFLLFYSCESNKLITSDSEDISAIYLFQNGKENRILDFEKAIRLERKPFSLRFFNKAYDSEKENFYSTQIAALLDKNELNEIQFGKSIDDITCFSPGTGLAASNGGYTNLFFGYDGHHYLFYENEERRRLNLIKKQGDFLKLEFEINSFFKEGKERAIIDFESTIFYLAVLRDLNLNGIVEEGELTKITIALNYN